MLTAVIIPESGWRVAQCLQLDMASQGNTVDEAIANLQEAIELYLKAPVSSLKQSPPDVIHRMVSRGDSEQVELTASVVLPSAGAWLNTAASSPPPGGWTFKVVRFSLEALGFDHVYQLGNHAKFVCEEPPRRAAILPHYRELTTSVVDSIFRQAEVCFT